MSKLYACIISPDVSRDKNAFVAVAVQFAHVIEVLDDGILFDVSGLERLMGKPDRIAQKILDEMRKSGVSGSVAVAGTVDTATLLARQQPVQSAGFSLSDKEQAKACTLNTPDMFEQLPLAGLGIERDTLNVFSELGIHKVGDLLAVPHDGLVSRYGRQFTDVIDVLEQRGRSLVTPNVKENRVSWNFELDSAVEDFEQLIFLLNHGLEQLFAQVDYSGFSTEHLDLKFKLRNNAEKAYEMKTSFPTLDRAFWLKLINLRGSLDPPEASITGVEVTAHFTRPRPGQRGLYAVSRPEPESLLLTVNKLKKLVGEDNVGVPTLLNQRLARPFTLDADAIPEGTGATNESKSLITYKQRLSRSICGEACLTGEEKHDLAAPPPCPKCGGIAANSHHTSPEKQRFWHTDRASVAEDRNRSANRAAEPPIAIIAFTYFRPPIKAEVLVRDGRLVFVRSRLFAGHVLNYSGVWRGASQWWDKTWRTQEWDIEVENAGVYRLAKAGEEWFLIGEYD